jgi:hypothetical protein
MITSTTTTDPAVYSAMATDLARQPHVLVDGPSTEVHTWTPPQTGEHVVAILSVLPRPRRRDRNTRRTAELHKFNRRLRDGGVARMLRRLRVELGVTELAIEHQPPLDDLWEPGRCQVVILRADADEVEAVGAIVQDVVQGDEADDC